MDKIKKSFIMDSFHEVTSFYANATTRIGLGQSEQYAFEKYSSLEDTILDIGCGTGRTTFALYNRGFQHITGLVL